MSEAKTNFKNGFTLIEVLIAITLLSFLMIGVFTIINNSTDMKDKVTLEDQDYLQVETALYRIELDFTLFYTPLFYSTRYSQGEETHNPTSEEDDFEISEELAVSTSVKQFKPSEKFNGITRSGHLIPTVLNEDKNELIFMTSNNQRKYAKAKESNYAWVKYSLENSDIEDKDQRKGDYMLVRQYSSKNPYTTDFEWDDIKAHILMRNVKSLQFSFWDPEKKEFTDKLKNTNSDSSLLRILKVYLEWIDIAGIENSTERTFRVLWPYFDTEKDLENYIKAANKIEGEDEDEDQGNFDE